MSCKPLQNVYYLTLRSLVFDGFKAFGFLGLFVRLTLIVILCAPVQDWRASAADHSALEVMKPAT